MIIYHASEEWQSLLTILNDCEEIQPIHTAGGAGRKSKEILGHRSIVSMTYPVVTCRGRNINYRFMCAEACMLLSGSDKVADIAPYCKMISHYSDDGVTFFGAYGPMIQGQLQYVANKLMEDPNTRQAVLTIWKPNPPLSKDIPCTLSLQFIIRKNRLHVFANMRSNDIWLGWPYDVFNFSMVGASMALWLRRYSNKHQLAGLELGNLYMYAGSLHLYDSHYGAAGKVSSENGYQPYTPLDIDNFVNHHDLHTHLKNLADNKRVTNSFLKSVLP